MVLPSCCEIYFELLSSSLTINFLWVNGILANSKDTCWSQIWLANQRVTCVCFRILSYVYIYFLWALLTSSGSREMTRETQLTGSQTDILFTVFFKGPVLITWSNYFCQSEIILKTPCQSCWIWVKLVRMKDWTPDYLQWMTMTTPLVKLTPCE